MKMTMSSSSEWSRRLASDLGERDGRSVSWVFGDGLNSLTGGDLQSDESKELVHIGMIAVVIGFFFNPKNASNIAAATAVTAVVLWESGRNR